MPQNPRDRIYGDGDTAADRGGTTDQTGSTGGGAPQTGASTYQPPRAMPGGMYNGGGAKAMSGGGGAGDGGIDAQIKAFYEHMLADMDPNDPMYQRIAQFANAQSMRSAHARGLGDSGFSTLNADQATKNALFNEQTRRQGLGLQALQLGANRDLGLRGLQQQANQMNWQRQQDMYGRDVSQGQGIGGLIGGGLGLGAGIVATAATGGAAAPLIPGLMAGGSQLGSGIGGMVAGGNSKYGGYSPAGGYGSGSGYSSPYGGGY